MLQPTSKGAIVMPSSKEKIAIVGMACRFPGSVTSLDEFWRLLREERDAVTEIPPERFGTDYYWHPWPREPGKSYTFAAGVLDDVAGFDAGFFGISPREAQQMDPQQRLLLELAWEVFEDAGMHPADMRGGRGGVYVGGETPDYSVRQADDPCSSDPYSATGSTLSTGANRVSYLFDLRGASMTVSTACSSSLVALHQAVLDMQAGHIDFALAGGINLLTHPGGFIGFAKASMLSPRGRCRAFDATGDGYVRAEGAALVLLKPLKRALADGDVIHAVIAGSGVNSDGYTPGGISVPGAATQAALMRSVYARAGIDPLTFSYFEAHGTGTAVGDPIETRAIGEVAAAGRSEDDPLLIGSVKTNIGHLETVSGMAGLFKAVLCIKHRAAPRTLHFETPNPAIDFKGLRLKVVDRCTPLQARGKDGITVGLNSFGFGGTNAHVVLTEPPAPKASARARAARAAKAAAKELGGALPPLVLTARSTGALAALAERYLGLLDAGHGWPALAAQTARRRQWLEQRAIIAPADLAEGRGALAALAQGRDAPGCVAQGQAVEEQARVALIFSGNGAQWPGMGRRLYDENAVFRAALDEVDALWRADGSASLVEVMRAGATSEWLAATENTQPLLFAIQVGVTRVLQARGIRFEATAGHSVGEIAAAWADGALTLAEAVHVIQVRSRAQALTRGQGRMAAAGVGEADARQVIDGLGLTGQVEIAGMNSPQSVTLVGALPELQRIEAEFGAKGQFFRILELEYPFHSVHMDAIQPMVLEQLADLEPRDGAGGYVSTVTGEPLAGAALDARYWWRNIREPVRFGAALDHLAAKGVRLFIEVGPHAILQAYVKQTLAAVKLPCAALATLKRDHDSAAELEHELLSAVAQGAQVALDTFVPDSAAARIALPTYPWQHERYWITQTPEGYNLVNRHRQHPLLGYRLRDAAWAWENEIDPARMPMLADHKFDDGTVFPGAGYVEIALAAAREFFGTPDAAIENMEIFAPVVFTVNQTKVIRMTIDPATARFLIETRDRMSDASAWTRNALGRLLASGNQLREGSDAERIDVDALMAARSKVELPVEAIYKNAIGMEYGPAFHWVRKLWLLGDAQRAEFDVAVADLEVPEAIGPAGLAGYNLHPALIDSGFHPLFPLVGRIEEIDDADFLAHIPVQMGRIDYLRGDTVRRTVMQIERRSPHSAVASVSFLDADNVVVARLASCRFRRVDMSARRASPPAHLAYILEARPLPGRFEARALPAPADLIEQALARPARPGAQDPAQRMRHLTEIMPLLDVLASVQALAAFDALEAFAQPERLSGHAALAERLAAMLVEDGLARREGERLVRDDAACAQLPAFDELWRSLLAEAPDHVAELTLLAHCGTALPRVLAGELPADQVLSPTGASLVEHFFQASPTWSYAHRLMSACAEQALDAWRDARRLRVLEIEAPDGSALCSLEAHLPEARCDRVLAGSAGQIAGFSARNAPGARTQAWPPAEDADDAAPYDLVLVKRALSTLPDPLHTLDHIYDRLAPGGLLVLAESAPGRLAGIVFGACADGAPDPRAVSFVPAELAWLLERAGFADVTRHDEAGLKLEGVPNFIVARKPADAPGPQSEEKTAAAQERCWLMLPATAADADVGAALAEALTQAGGAVEAVPADQAAARVAALPERQVGELVFLAPVAGEADADGAAMMRAQEAGVIALARLVRELGATGRAGNLRLNIVTRGGAPFEAGADQAPTHPEQASLWGLGRVIANEYSGWQVRLIDVHPGRQAQPSSADLAALAAELLHGDEEEVLLHAAGRQVPRLLAADEAARRQTEPASLPAVLDFESPGLLRNLEWSALPGRALEADEVEIEPVATGLNFRDVMYAMGLLSDEAVEAGFAGASLGMEFSGRVTRLGAAVQGFAPGDAVLGFAPASFAARVRTRGAALAHKPAALPFEAAATIPTTFFTAWYALVEMAHLRRGERVLVHGGAGGVGIAAIQIARHLGAEVFATAGSNEKRAFVALLGADHVLDSRSLAFADRIRALTRGEGIDVVLNSLAGEAMVRSIDTLRPFGRFLELGKRDFYENSLIGLRPFRNNISYFGIDADQLMGVHPALTERLFGELMRLFEAGALHPLPYRAFAAAQVEAAFRYMQQSRQIGKVLVTYPRGTPAPTRGLPASAPTRPTLDAGGAYLIVGGTGGLGFVTARWMVQCGARHLTLIGRRGALDEAQREEIGRWQADGAQVEAVACDATDAGALAGLIESIEARGTPVRGAVHSAMQIEDGMLRNLDDARFAAALAPKVAGAWNLHRLLGRRPLDCFIVYSSMTTYLGSPGQGNYVAANSFLEALVALRRAAGLKANFMAWGPIQDVGFLARNTGTRDAVQSRTGGASITSAEALEALAAALAADLFGEAVVRLDWRTVGRSMPTANARRYAYIRARSASEADVNEDGGAQLGERIGALPPEEAQQLAAEALRAQIARILHLPLERIELDKSLLDMGMDSLMGMELGLAVQENFQVKLPMMAISEGATVLTLASRIVASIQHKNEGGGGADNSINEQAATALSRIHAVEMDDATRQAVLEDPAPAADVSAPDDRLVIASDAKQSSRVFP